MYNPPHVGEIIKEDFLSEYGISVSEFAKRIGINRAFASKIINGKAGVSTAMAYRLEKLFGVSVDTWLDLQRQYDKWITEQVIDVSNIEPIKAKI
jgi:addiction module HigA family antidote